MSLFSLKKTLSFSLSFSSALSLSFFDMLCFGCRFVFFFLSFRALLFVLGERSRVLVFSLSFFPCFCWGDRKTHPFVSLSLSLTKRAFWKTRSPSRMLRGTRREIGMIISEKKEEISTPPRINSRAKEEEKKRWIGFLLIAAREPQPQRVVASKTKTHISENKSMLPSVRPRGACLQNSFFSRCFNIYIYVCVYSIRSL